MRRRLAATLITMSLLAAACAIPATGTIALDDAAETEAGGRVEIPLLVNDRPPWGENIAIDTIDGARGGVEIIEGGWIAYTAPAGFSGADRFTYTIVSDSGSTASAEVVVTVFDDGSPPTTTTTEPPEPGDPVLVLPERLDFGEVFVANTSEQSFSVFAEAGDFNLEPIDFGEIQLIPDGNCRPLPEGRECEVTVRWTPQAPVGLELPVPVADGFDIVLTGSGIPSLVFEPQHQMVEAAESFVFVTATLVNLSPQPVTLTGAPRPEEVVEVNFDECNPILVDDALPGGAACAVFATVDVSWIPPGGSGDLSFGVTYAATITEAFFTFVAPDVEATLAAPVWVFPEPGQEFFYQNVLGGFTAFWDPVPGATEYTLAADVCWNDGTGCTFLLAGPDLGASSGFVAAADPAALEETFLAKFEAGFPVELVLLATAQGTGPDGQTISSEPSQLVVPLVP